MHYFISEIGQLQVGSVSGFLRRAEFLSDENMTAYVTLVLRRPFAKIIVSHFHPLGPSKSTHEANLGLFRWRGTSPDDHGTNGGC